MLFGHFTPDCIRSNLRGCNFKIFLGRGVGEGGGGMPPHHRSRHPRVSHSTIILLSSCPPPISKSCVKPCSTCLSNHSLSNHCMSSLATLQGQLWRELADNPQTPPEPVSCNILVYVIEEGDFTIKLEYWCVALLMKLCQNCFLMWQTLIHYSCS